MIAWAADIDKFANLNPHENYESIQHQALMDMWILQRYPPARCKQNTINADNPFIPAYPKMNEVEVDASQADTSKGIQAGKFKVIDCEGYGDPKKKREANLQMGQPQKRRSGVRWG